MSLEELIEQLEEKYYGDWEEDREPVVEVLLPIQNEALASGIDSFRGFANLVKETCGGIYVPYLMWVELAWFMDHREDRQQIHNLVATFVESGFEEEERKKMKSLIITYFSLEREFEVNKLMTLIVSKTHPTVQEYFRKMQNFVEKNKTSVDMYIEKFTMIKAFDPDFDLLRMPVIKLKEHLTTL
ncbi:MAG: hypothetical protein AAGN35_23920 [Bacteroidota bacterium]